MAPLLFCNKTTEGKHYMKVQMIITLDSSDAQAVIDKLEEMEQECETKHAFSVEIEPIKLKGINMNKETNDKMEWVDNQQKF
tara:strand:+ start:2322 stop:2567 length:246 start_codon:yes stop_codon:yes gene_type:complete